MSTTPWTRQHGFTLVELLVTVVVMAIMMVIVGEVFKASSETVRQGTALSRIIGSVRMISEQIDEDMQAMTRPTDGGFLVILQNRQAGVAMKSRWVRAEIELGQKFLAEDIRDDQVIFIRNAYGLNLVSPGSTDSFSNTATGAHARVFLGHVRKTNTDGTDGGNLGFTLPDSPNLFGTNWILGRQALLLAGPNGKSPVHIYDGAEYDNLVWGYPVSPDDEMYFGYSDVSDQMLSDLTGPSGKLTLASDYKDAAYRYTFATERLRVNPTVSDSSLPSVEVARQHAIFAANVSDFAIEFAADIVSPRGELDTYYEEASGERSIKWYTHDEYADDNSEITFPTHKVPVGYAPYVASPGLNHANAAFVWRHDEPDEWPYLIRIRYRIHDRKGVLQSDGIEQFDDEEIKKVKKLGRWFELIFKVNRD